jgi:hypothetical protein
MDSLAPISELSNSFLDDASETQEGAFGDTLSSLNFLDLIDEEVDELIAEADQQNNEAHQGFTAQLLAVSNEKFGAGIARSSAVKLASAEPAVNNLKDSNS